MQQSHFREVKKRFDALSPQGRDELLRDLYQFSRDTRLFLENRLLGGGASGQEFVQRMKRETVDKVYRMPPGDINGRTVDSIIAKAKKSGVAPQIITELELLAYRGFIEYLNEYGGGPATYEGMAERHLEEYLTLVKQTVKIDEERVAIFAELKRYLEHKDNMYTDELDVIFTTKTGIAVAR